MEEWLHTHPAGRSHAPRHEMVRSGSAIGAAVFCALFAANALAVPHQADHIAAPSGTAETEGSRAPWLRALQQATSLEDFVPAALAGFSHLMEQNAQLMDMNAQLQRRVATLEERPPSADVSHRESCRVTGRLCGPVCLSGS